MFQWDAKIMNLLSSIDYNPEFPWFKKVRTHGNIENDILVFIKNVRDLGW